MRRVGQDERCRRTLVVQDRRWRFPESQESQIAQLVNKTFGTSNMQKLVLKRHITSIEWNGEYIKLLLLSRPH